MGCYKHDQEAHYHFTLSDVVEYVKIFGVDKVMTDIYDMLAENCNREVSQLEMEFKE
jgi:hypothetical protein